MAVGGGSSTPPCPAAYIGMKFVKEYYTVLAKEPHKLHTFYKAQSVFSRGVEGAGAETTVSAVGPGEIHSEIMACVGSFEHYACRAEISHVESQESLQGGVLVLVIGHLTFTHNQERQHFTQVFFLDRQSEPYDGYFVLNDMLRLIPGEASGKGENSHGPQAAQAAPTVPAPVSAAPPSQTQLQPQTLGPAPTAAPQPQLQPQAPPPQLQAAWSGYWQQQQQEQQQQAAAASQLQTAPQAGPQLPVQPPPLQPPTRPPRERPTASGVGSTATAAELSAGAEGAQEGTDGFVEAPQEEDSGDEADAPDCDEYMDDHAQANEADGDDAAEEAQACAEEAYAEGEEEAAAGGMDEAVQEEEEFVQEEEKPGPRSWASMASMLKSVPGNLKPSTTKGWAKPAALPVLPPPTAAAKAEAARAVQRQQAATKAKMEAGGQETGVTSSSKSASTSARSPAAATDPSGSVRMWISRLPPETPTGGQELVDTLNSLLVEAGHTDLRALEVDRKDFSGGDWGYLMVSSQESVEAIVQLSKDRKITMQGKMVRAEYYRAPGFGASAQFRQGRGRGKGGGGGGEEDSGKRGGEAKGEGKRGRGKDGGYGADRGSEERSSGDGKAKGGMGWRRPGKGTDKGGSWRGGRGGGGGEKGAAAA